MENYTPNSFKYKEEQKKSSNTEKPKLQKVVDGPVTTVKKSGFKKFKDSIIAEDIPKVKEFVLSDVLIPSIKKAISDIVRNGIDMILYGESRSNNNSGRVNARVSYRDYYNGGSTNNERARASATRSAYDFDDPLFKERGAAELVLDQMEACIEKYGFVRISDLFDLSGITTDNYCYYNYGWTDLRNAAISRVSDGYIIRFPKAFPLN